jgi:hypothetical protein
MIKRSKHSKGKPADYMISSVQTGFDPIRFEARRAVRENGENVGSGSLGVFDTHEEADAAIEADIAAGNRPGLGFVYGAHTKACVAANDRSARGDVCICAK